jgi:transcription initiation factor TFIIIB Brf1 subunit/transcription initiation factor TFIIB
MRRAGELGERLAGELEERLPDRLRDLRGTLEDLAARAARRLKQANLQGRAGELAFSAALELELRREGASREGRGLFDLCRLHAFARSELLLETESSGSAYFSVQQALTSEERIPAPLPPACRVAALLESLGLEPEQLRTVFNFFSTARRRGYLLEGKKPSVVAAALAHIWSSHFGLGMTQADLADELGVSKGSIVEHKRRLRTLDLNLYSEKPNFSEREVRRWKYLYEELGTFRAVERAEQRISRRTGKPAPSVVTIIDRLRAAFPSRGEFEDWRNQHTALYTPSDVEKWREIYKRAGSFRAVRRRLRQSGADKVPSVPTIADRLKRRVSE